jgi:serine/threonine protein kinase/Tol biopolymer transport system component
LDARCLGNACRFFWNQKQAIETIVLVDFTRPASYYGSPHIKFLPTMIGQRLGHYRILEKIGSGGMGEVYRASDDRLAREVAVKILKPEYADDHDRLRRFEQEARSAAALNHPNIVAIYDIGLHDGAPYIVSELLQGHTLRQRLYEGPLTSRISADYGAQIAQGLIAAHEKRIVHRDLKPENLFITTENRIKILDFGIAKLTTQDAGDDRSVQTMTTQTKAGSILGTVAYMSPEQLRGKPVDHRSDIFSFGAILFEMLSGKRAFAGETEVDTMTAVLKEEPAEIATFGLDVAPAFEQIVRHCLEKEPENRFQSARDLAFAMETLGGTSAVRVATSYRNHRAQTRRWPVILLVTLIVTALGFALGYLFIPRMHPLYHRITFQRGTIYTARFATDGRTVLYSASWNGRPLQIYSTLPDSLLARPLDLAPANLLALSRSSELALSMHGTAGGRVEFEHATLARVPMVGSTPREIMHDVPWADWSLSGELAVVHHASSKDNLEYPIGHVLYSTTGAISHLRFSPQGDRIAFLDHPGRYDVRGTVSVVDLSGKKTVLTHEWQEEYGLAWSPSGDEVWFAAVEDGATERSLWAVTLAGKIREILAASDGFTLHDIAADGRALVSVDSERLGMEWSGKNGATQDLSWFEWSLPRSISRDGKWVLFQEGSPPTGDDAIAIRSIDGTPPIQLGKGSAEDLSPDGKWALSLSPDKPVHLTLLPVGAGQAKEIPLPGFDHLQMGAQFLPDGKRVVIDGNLSGHAGQSFVVDLADGQPRAITPEGSYATVASPDGKYVAGGTTGQPVTMFPIDGGAPQTVPVPPGYGIANWTTDSKALLVYRPGEVPLNVYRLEVASGKMTLVRDLVPPDRTGVVSISPVVGNGDGTEFAYGYYQTLSDLFVISGLK